MKEVGSAILSGGGVQDGISEHENSSETLVGDSAEPPPKEHGASGTRLKATASDQVNGGPDLREFDPLISWLLQQDVLRRAAER